MSAGCHLRHHAAETRMEISLRGNDARQNLWFFGEYRSRGFVTGSFNGEKVHPLCRLKKRAIVLLCPTVSPGTVTVTTAKRRMSPFHPGAPTLAGRTAVLAAARVPLTSGQACQRALWRKKFQGLSYTTLLMISSAWPRRFISWMNSGTARGLDLPQSPAELAMIRSGPTISRISTT